MKLILAAIALILILETNAQWYKFPGEAIAGAGDMLRAFIDMKKANWKNSDKYFHARGNYDAAQRGAGGRWAAEVISNGNDWIKGILGRDAQDRAADREADQWGQRGNNPNRLRPNGLPPIY